MELCILFVFGSVGKVVRGCWVCVISSFEDFSSCYRILRGLFRYLRGSWLLSFLLCCGSFRFLQVWVGFWPVYCSLREFVGCC